MYTAERGGGEGQNIFLKGAKFVNIPPPHIIQSFFTTPLLTEIKIDIPPLHLVLKRTVKYGQYDEMVKRLKFKIEN